MPEASVRRPPEPHKRERGAKPGLERGSDRFVSILLSVLVHAVIVGALLWGWWRYRTPPAPPATLAIEGRVVRETPQLRTGTPPSVQAPPDQTRIEQQHQAAQAKAAAALAAQAAAAKAAAQKAAEAQAAAQEAAQQVVEKAAAEKLAAEQATAAKAAQEQAQRAADEKAATEKAAERAAAEKTAAEAKLAAERKARAEAEAKAKAEAAREAQLMAQQMKAEQAERLRQQDLQSEVQQEEKLDALKHGPAETQYGDLIKAKITRAWIRPASAQPGITCIVHIMQIAGGEVTHVTVENCNGDDAVRQSVQTAAYRASPLPPPPDPALFDPNITVTFAPDQ